MITIKVLRSVALFWGYFIGLGAVVGFAMMTVDPSGEMWGMTPLLPLLREAMPAFEPLFRSFTASSIVLIMVNGATNALSVVAIHRHHPKAATSSLACGIILIAWIIFEFVIFGFNPLSDIYLVFGIFQSANAILWIAKSRHTPSTTDKTSLGTAK